MDWLCRIFYTVLSLSGIMVFLTPAVLGVRFVMRHYEKSFMKWEWRMVYLRSICPIALSSVICIFPTINRQYHLFLSELGLNIKDQVGIMNSWRAVFLKEIDTTLAFEVCAIIWAVGVVIVLVGAFLAQRRVQEALLQVKELGEDIYESSLLSVPVRLGMLHKKQYLPKNMQTKEMAWYLKHIEQHGFENTRRFFVVLITSIHWFNPIMWLYYVLWSHDEEYMADESTVHKAKLNICRDYAQGILNFKQKEKQIVMSLFSIYERNITKRARRMMYPKWDTTSVKLGKFLLISLTFILCFMLLPMKIAWSGGTWQTKDEAVTEESLFKEKDNIVVAKTDTMSPDGLDRVVQLEMVSQKEDSKNRYIGDFALVMYDNLDNKIASVKMEDLFGEKDSYTFPKEMTLYVGDYNGDSSQEVVLGQKLSLSQEEFKRTAPKSVKLEKTKDYNVYSYTVVDIENDALTPLATDICSATKKDANTENQLSESIALGVIEDVTTVFSVPFADVTLYYVWNAGSKKYEEKTLTQQELENYKKGEEADSQGETLEHTLENGAGDVEVLVSTKRDSTDSEEIQSLTISPRKNDKKINDIHGYFCDLQWVKNGDETESRYAMLIYNGTRAQTFSIYDTKSRTAFYKHEDGTQKLSDIFKQYKEDDISFDEGGAVIYTLNEMNDDKLSIGFAADADSGITVKGSYLYDVKKKSASNFAYTREVNDTTNATATPTSDAN